MLKYLCLFIYLILIIPSFSQNNAGANVYVDKDGVIRWKASDEAIKGFGVNYTVPFAHAYRSAGKLGIAPKTAIEQDVYHMARMGFDLYRIHVWDTEISDTLGNLITNEHLDAFDFLIHKLKERDINFIITPIAFWGNGWPEPDEPTPGFSAKYGKARSLTSPGAIKAQTNYLEQFIQHINPYTGIAYKDDPSLIAVEVSNEPHHREAPEKVTAFIQQMAEALRSAGYQKPIFYNTSHSVHLMEHYFDANIQGGTFQWYPTGLVHRKALPINALINVDDYKIPFDSVFRENGKAKIVYEFDAADIDKSYVLPAMARSFREAGIQLATYFCYDPMFLAHANTEYNTHYMNLAYTPQKALSLMIAAEIFHEIPMYSNFGNYPANNRFDNFRVSFEENLSLLNAPDKYYYTNNVQEPPVANDQLEHIAGYGNSPIVKYDGTGAYFLDKLESGIWRLEVMPDALIVKNPYGYNSLKKTVAITQNNLREIEVQMEDLGQNFVVKNASTNSVMAEADVFSTKITPGTYILQASKYLQNRAVKNNNKHIGLDEFVAPKASVVKTHLVHQPVLQATAGEKLKISAQVTGPDIQKLEVHLYLYGRRGAPISMEKERGFTFSTTLSEDIVSKGFLEYYIVVNDGETTTTFPADIKGTPYEWDFYKREPYRVRIVGKDQSIQLFNAQEDYKNILTTRWINSLKLMPLDHPGESAYQVNVAELYRQDEENLNGPIIYDYSIQSIVAPKLKAVQEQLLSKKKLMLKAGALNGKPVKVRVLMLGSNGTAIGKVIELQPQMEVHELAIDELIRMDRVVMPRPYPTFLSYFYKDYSSQYLDLRDLESIQISLGPDIPEKELKDTHGFALARIWLE